LTLKQDAVPQYHFATKAIHKHLSSTFLKLFQTHLILNDMTANGYLKRSSVSIDSWTRCLVSSMSLWKMDAGSKKRFACN